VDYASHLIEATLRKPKLIRKRGLQPLDAILGAVQN